MAIQAAAILGDSKATLIPNVLESGTKPASPEVRRRKFETAYFPEIVAAADKALEAFDQVRQDVVRLLHRPWGKREVSWTDAEWDRLERQSQRYNTQALMISCGTVTIDKASSRDRRILLIWNKRIGAWQLPKGRRNIDEDFAVAALRETKEETGVEVRPLYLRFGTRFTIPTNSRGLEDGEVAQRLRKRPFKTGGGGDGGCDNGIMDVLNRDMFYSSEYPDPATGAMRHIYWYAAKPDQSTTCTRDLMGQEDLLKMEMRWFPAPEAVYRLKMSVEKEAVALAVYYAEQMSEEEWRYSQQL
ncbi:uncharacterized protein BCR38DRAFT_482966 [Pseudomassariella vexata]|uniref:Nudix hydrolase domain-containing protein n=1 Tax=Pseudomassariella vexata TaxID=1141098 RepID=A0A1Y2E7T4_9PEZI|nr:uncharacterized protein BCR38DRAFT_482966 [Pseudomassariella vexata]ORY67346.1 hypothetical protein BCR38DRAFT_482966 [Pseudomassariella vexata]